MNYQDESIARVARRSGSSVVGMLTWTDPSGDWWMAPLGSEAPDPDRPMPPAWLKIKIVPREEGQ